MDRIRDLTETNRRDDDLLTGTSGGLFDTQYLSGEPPAASLEPYEQPQYVLRNKKSGIERTGENGEQSNTPDDDYQALAVVTDCRVLFFVGHADGDHVETVAHDEIVEARAESSGLMTSTLLVERLDGERLRFACRGDVSAVAAYVDDAAQTWATASRLVKEASDRLEASRASLDDGAFADAREVLTDVSEDIDYARDHVSAIGEGATTALDSRASQVLNRLRELEGEIAATKGAHHHAAAQDAWKTDHDFERAAREYERGAKEYERALATDGQTPSGDAVGQRLKGLVKERTVLRVAPMADARAAREVAMSTDDPEEAATEWETALTCYREAATLDWGEHDREFFVERDRARERAGEAATEAVDAHIDAGSEWVTAGDKIVRNGRRREARQAYQRAEQHFSTAADIARELQPARLEDIEEQLSALEKRKTGEVVPAVEPDEATLSVDAVADKLTADSQSTRHTGGAVADTSKGSEKDETEPTGASRQATPDVGTAESATARRTPADRLDHSTEYTPAIRQRATPNEQRADADTRPAITESTGPEGTASEESRRPVDERPITERETRIEGDDGSQTTRSKTEQGSPMVRQRDTDTGQETALSGGTSTTTDVPISELLAGLDGLDGPGLTELVAQLWEQNGWATTVFSQQTEAAYDILALGPKDGSEQRLLLWTVHRPNAGTVDATVVRRCATTRDSSRGADGATLVTTGTLTSAARQRAEDLDVTVVDREALLEALLSAGHAERLLD